MGEIEYLALTDRATPVNLTSHSYFNLAARPGCDIRVHRVKIQSDAYVEVDAALIPRQCAPVYGGPFDFRHEASMGSRFDVSHPQLNHCWHSHRAERIFDAVIDRTDRFDGIAPRSINRMSRPELPR
ncbi:aldose epimerase family protein [Paraburkholderia fungorum]|uniref:aldose epimerase family protein n=1 Tax=Paraburkholderia fungorum TaxID=134537 RepID=UPI0038B959F3